MGDLYGISNAVMEANSLHGQIALNEELAKKNYTDALNTFNKNIKDQKSGDSQSNKIESAEDAPDLGALYQTGKGIYGGLKGAATGGSEAASEFSSSLNAISRARIARTAGVARQVATITRRQGRAAAGAAADVDEGDEFEQVAARAMSGETGLGGGVLSDVSDAAASAARSAATSIANTADIAYDAGATTLELAGEGTRATGAVLSGAAKGFIAGAAETGGEGAGVTGAGAIVKGVITKIGGEGAETFGELAGRATGAAGGIIAAGDQIDSLIESGGKSMFTRVNAQGQRVAMSGTDKASEILNEVGAGADVLAASTGGLLVPVAAALNLAGAITGVIGNYLDEKADDKNIGLKADGTTDASKAPKLAAQPIGEAFTGLGFVGNMSHNPLDHIA